MNCLTFQTARVRMIVCCAIAVTAVTSGFTQKKTRPKGQFCFVLTLSPRLYAFLNKIIFTHLHTYLIADSNNSYDIGQEIAEKEDLI